MIIELSNGRDLNTDHIATMNIGQAAANVNTSYLMIILSNGTSIRIEGEIAALEKERESIKRRANRNKKDS